MSRKGNCFDNAAIESFFGTLKAEYVHLAAPDSLDALEAGVHDYVHYYNHERIKLKLQGLSPVQYRLRSTPDWQHRHRPTSGAQYIRRGDSLATLYNTDDRVQIRDHGLEATNIHPASTLLVDRLPRRKSIGQQSPGGASAHEPTQRFEDFTHVVMALGHVHVPQYHVQCGIVPSFIGDIGGVRLAWLGANSTAIGCR